MNTSKRKQKAIRLGIAAVLALVLLVSVSVVLVIANETPEVQADAMTVTLDGKVNLIFKFNDENVKSGIVSYTAVIGEGGREIAGLESVKDGENRDVVTVPLMPYEMTETVSLYQVAEDGTNLAVSTGSVRGYADEVLAREDLAEYHNSVRALLNYGAKTQIDADKNASNLANDGLFVRNNPIDIIKAVPFGKLDEKTGDLTGEISLVFSNNNGISDIALRYDITYEAGHDEELRAVINGASEGVRLQEVESGKYRFEITNIGVKNFATVWNVVITAPDGKTSTSQHSVLEYLDWNIKDKSTPSTEKDVARSLYQLYQNTQENKLETNCAHKNSGYYIPADANSSYLMCAACGNKIQDAAINNNVTAYFSGEHLAAVDTEFGVTPNVKNGEYSYTFTNTNTDTNTDTGIGTLQHIWLREQYIVQTTGEASMNPVSGRWANTSFDIGNAQYVVIRYKWSNRESSTGITLSLGSAAWTWEDTGYIDGDKNFVSTGGAVNQGGIYSEAKFVAGDGYMTYVISLDKFGDKVKAANGSRIIDSMKIVIEGKTDDVLNIDYIAFVEDWTKCDGIIEDSTVQLVMSTDGKIVYEMKKDGTCVNHVSTETIEKGETSDTYKYTCTVCGSLLSSKDVPHTTNKYLSATELNSGLLPKSFSNGKYSVVDGSVLRLEKTAEGAVECLWLRERYTLTAGGIGGGDFTFNGKGNIDAGTARYMIIKLKTEAACTINILLGTTGWTYNDYETPSNQNGIFQEIKLKTSKTPDDGWTVYVVDLDTFGDKVRVDAEGKRIIDSFRIVTSSISAGAGVDIAYAAFADDWAEMAELVDESTVVKVESSSISEVSTSTGYKYLTANNLAGGAAVQCTAAVADGNLKFTTNDSASEIQYIWLREKYYASATAYGQGDPLGLSGQINKMGADTTIDAGSANYIVVKVKSSVATTPMLRFSTTAYNYDKQADTQKWGQSAISDYISFKITSEMAGQWTVFAIDLETCGERVAKLDGKRVFDTFMLTGLKGLNSTDSFEIQYIAFADNMDDVKELAGTDTVVTVTKPKQ